MNTDEFSIKDRTDVGVVTVYTIEHAAPAGRRQYWILACNPESGDDLLISPKGTHSDPSNLRPEQTAARRLVEWIVSDGWKEF